MNSLECKEISWSTTKSLTTGNKQQFVTTNTVPEPIKTMKTQQKY